MSSEHYNSRIQISYSRFTLQNPFLLSLYLCQFNNLQRFKKYALYYFKSIWLILLNYPTIIFIILIITYTIANTF